MNERFLNLVTTKLIMERQLLEGELEVVLNDAKLSLEEKVEKTTCLLKDIAVLINGVGLWENYNRPQQAQGETINNEENTEQDGDTE
tara:strand:- start:9339 stop:9599 length:261 start_codon:yes stop_codon:yes gene_type:complete